MRSGKVVSIALLGSFVTACGAAPTLFTTGGVDLSATPGMTSRWVFDDGLGPSSSDLITVLGDWTREPDASSPSAPNVLRQKASYGTPDFPRVVVKDLTFADLDVQVRCRPESGSTDEACGLMFRLQDSDNYYITRANALEDNVRLYRVMSGDRQQFASASLSVTGGQWHTLAASARGAELKVSWDGTEIISAHDESFGRGKIGLWTKSDSVTAFDDLEATAR